MHTITREPKFGAMHMIRSEPMALASSRMDGVVDVSVISVERPSVFNHRENREDVTHKDCLQAGNRGQKR